MIFLEGLFWGLKGVREAPFSLLTPPCGHCPNSIYTPPPALKRAPWGTFFQARF